MATKEKSKNPMKNIRVFKVTLNMGTGKSADLLEKGMTLIKNMVGTSPVKCFTNKKIAAWGLRPGLPIGCKLTLRKEMAEQFLANALYAKDNTLNPSCFDDCGNISFGVPEYIDVKDAKYDPKIGIIGFQVSVTLEKPGFRVKRRKVRSAKLSKAHQISREDAMGFMAEKFNVKVQEASE